MDPSDLNHASFALSKHPILNICLNMFAWFMLIGQGFKLLAILVDVPKLSETLLFFVIYDFHSDSEAITMSSDCNEEDIVVDANVVGDNCSTGQEFSEALTPLQKKRAAATWILKVQEVYKLPQSTMESIIKDTIGFFQDSLIDLCDEVEYHLNKAGIDFCNIPRLAALFQNSSPYANPFSELGTQYSQLQFYKEAFNFLVSG